MSATTGATTGATKGSRIGTTDADAIVDIHVPFDHPSFAGHFPGRPLLPGVLLLAEVIEAVDLHAGLKQLLGNVPAIESCKFLAPVEPGSPLRIVLRSAASGAVQFEVSRGDVVVAKGRLSPGAEGAAAP